jgi:hypothetical protein
LLRRFALLLLLAPLACSDDPTDPGDGSARATVDRADQRQGAQVHVVYALPANGIDQGLDTTGALATSIASFQRWLLVETGGRHLRMDVHEDALDVTFVRLARADATMSSYGVFLRDSLEREMGRRGLIQPNKVYAVYYDGGNTHACGGAAWPPTVPGQVAAMYLKGTPPNVSCARPFVSSQTAFPGYWEFAMLHDLLHTFGIVALNAPHHTSAVPGHVPERNDLMYSGSQPWVIDQTTEVDVGGDDYFGAGVPAGVVRLESSPYMISATGSVLGAPSAASPLHGGGRSVDVVRLPPHPPLSDPTPVAR